MPTGIAGVKSANPHTRVSAPVAEGHSKRVSCWPSYRLMTVTKRRGKQNPGFVVKFGFLAQISPLSFGMGELDGAVGCFSAPGSAGDIEAN